MYVLVTSIVLVLGTVAAEYDTSGLNISRNFQSLYEGDILNPVVLKDTFNWGGLYSENVASEGDCETFCLDNICEVANYVASSGLCFIALDAKTIRRINTNADLSISGGLCDASGCVFKSNKIFLPEVKHEYAPGQNQVRSAQHCFMLCDMSDETTCPAFVFHNEDNDTEGKGNACTFYKPKDPVESLPIPGFYSALKTSDWAPSVVGSL